jgi:hypothetical protein
MNFGFWISPDGKEIDVHSVAPFTHHGHALSLGAPADSHNPIMSLLKLGWIRVSLDVIQVWDMTERKRSVISSFVGRHPEYYRDDVTVLVEDELAESSTSVPWNELS